LRNAEARHETDWYYVKAEHDFQAEIQAFIEMMRKDPSKVAFLSPEMESFLAETPQKPTRLDNCIFLS